MAELPCRNPQCNSVGQPHPNCKCYGAMAQGGVAGRFCDSSQAHQPGCQYAKGGTVDKSGFSFHSETPTHYTVKHPKGDEIKIAKKGISSELHSQIKKMAEGGKVDPANAPKEPIKWDKPELENPYQGPSMPMTEPPKKESSPVTINIHNAKPEPQHFDEGGQAQPAAAPAEANPMQPQQGGAPVSAPSALLPGADASSVPNVVGQLQGDAAHISQSAQQQAGAEKAIAAQSIPVYQAQQRQAQEQFDRVKYTNDAITSEQMNLADDLASGKVDFNRVWHNASTPKQITAALGMALGQIGAGLTHGPNAAMQFIDSIIARDVDSQKQEMNNKKTAIGAYNDVLQNIDHSTQLMQTLGKTAVMAQLNKITAGQGGPLAEAKKNLLLGQLLPQLQAQTYNLAVQKANWDYLMHPAAGQAANPQSAQAGSPQSGGVEPSVLGRTGNVDLEQLKRLQLAKVVPEEATKEAKDFQEAQDTKKLLLDDLNQMHDSVIKNRGAIDENNTITLPNGKKVNNPLPAGIDPLTRLRLQKEIIGKLPWGLGKPAEGMEPWGGKIGAQYNAAQTSAKIKLNKLLGARVTPEILQNIQSLLPEPSDSDEEIISKTKRVMQVIDATNAAPTLQKWNLIK